MVLQPGATIRNYIIDRPIGLGPNATVYSVRYAPYATPNATHTMKIYNHSQGQTTHLVRSEIDVLLRILRLDPQKRVSYTPLVEYFDLSGGFTCLVFPFYGRSIRSFLRSNSNIAFPFEHVQRIARQILTALDFIYSIGIVHCDVRSDNILLTDSNYHLLPHPTLGVMRKVLHDPNIKLSDFGKARIIIGRKQFDAVKGPFLSLETCLRLPWDYGVDVYGAGLILHEMASGRHLIPTEADAATTLALLRQYKGPLPDNLARHAEQGTNVPSQFTSFRSMSVQPQVGRRNSTQATFEEMGARRSNLMDGAIRSRQLDIVMSGDAGGAVFVNLLDKLLEYDPAKRIKAGDALQHAYFTFFLPPPTPIRQH